MKKINNTSGCLLSPICSFTGKLIGSLISVQEHILKPDKDSTFGCYWKWNVFTPWYLKSAKHLSDFKWFWSVRSSICICVWDALVLCKAVLHARDWKKNHGIMFLNT